MFSFTTANRAASSSLLAKSERISASSTATSSCAASAAASWSWPGSGGPESCAPTVPPPKSNAASAAPANDVRQLLFRELTLLSPPEGSPGRAQAVPIRHPAMMHTAARVLTNGRERRGRHVSSSRFTRRSIRRARLERKPNPPAETKPTARGRANREPKRNSDVARCSGPSTRQVVASSAVNSLSKRNRARMAQTAGFHHNALQIKSAISSHRGSA